MGRPHRRMILPGHARGQAVARADAGLLSLLSDGAPDDAGMISILHAAEATDDAGSIAGPLASVADLSATAPRGASIVLMRALNHAGTRHALVWQLREAPAPVRDAVRAMSERIAALDPDFLDRTAPVIAAAGPGHAVTGRRSGGCAPRSTGFGGSAAEERAGAWPGRIRVSWARRQSPIALGRTSAPRPPAAEAAGKTSAGAMPPRDRRENDSSCSRRSPGIAIREA